jgi:hypothetical protein
MYETDVDQVAKELAELDIEGRYEDPPGRMTHIPCELMIGLEIMPFRPCYLFSRSDSLHPAPPNSQQG